MSFDNDDSLISEIVKLRDLVKCPLCLNIVNNPLKISCDHILCAECVDSFLNKTHSKLMCPLCKKIIKRQRQKPNANFQQLVNFVNLVTAKLKDRLGCISTNYNENNFKVDTTIMTTEARRQSKSGMLKKPFICTNTNLSDVNIRERLDLLVSSSTSNPRFNSNIIQTYSRKKNKKNSNEELLDKLIDFEDNNYRLKIINWLCDNRNDFDRLTQTQSIIDDSASTGSSFDMPCVEEMKLAVNNREWHSNYQRRTRSLDVKVKSSKSKLRRHSFSGESQDAEEINIEEIESDNDCFNNDKVDLIQILEEKCLNTIDSQVMLQEKGKVKSRKSKNLKKRKRNSEDEDTKGADSGWTRIQEMNKTLNKNSREPKKLRVSLTAGAKKDKVDDSVVIENVNVKKKQANKMPIVILSRLSSEVEWHDVNTSKHESKVYALDRVESYISNNIIKCIQTGEEDETLNKENTCAISEMNSNPEMPKCMDNTIIKQPDPSLNTESCENLPENNINDDEINFTCRTSQGSNKKKLKIHSGSIFSMENTSNDNELFTAPTQKIISEFDVGDVEKNLEILFSSPKPSEKSITNDGFNASPKVNEVFDVLHQLDNHVNILEESIMKNISIDKIKLGIGKLKSMFTGCKHLNELLPNKLDEQVKNYHSITTQTSTFDAKSIAIQTEEYDTSGFKISSTADFKTLVRHTIGIQTDEIICHQPISIASDSSIGSTSRTSSIVLVNNDELLIRLKDNYQFTESMDNINFDTQVFLRNKPASSLKEFNNLKEKLSFDNDTDFRNSVISLHTDSDEVEVIEDETVIPMVVDNDGIEVPLTVQTHNDKKSIPTQNSNISFFLSQEKVDKKIVSTDLPNNTARFKRMRMWTEDDIASTKMKKKENPYVLSNLSVEILSEDIGKESGAPRNTEDYEEYNKIMQIYNGKNASTVSKTSNLPCVSRQTKSQDLMSKCDALIKQATVASTSISKRKLCYDHIPSEDILDEFNFPFDEKTDKNVTQAQQGKIEEKFSESIFPNDTDNIRNPLSTEMPFSNMKSIAQEFAEELEPISVKSVEKNSKSVEDINNLQNILLQKPDVGSETPELQYNLDEELQKLEDIERDSMKSEEVFSDSEVDFVDNTPQKERSTNSILFMSQSLHKRYSDVSVPAALPTMQDSPDVIFSTDAFSYLHKTFDPPTDFQDSDCDEKINEHLDVLNTDKFDVTIVPSNILKAIDLDNTVIENINVVTVNNSKIKLTHEKEKNKYQTLVCVDENIDSENLNKSLINDDNTEQNHSKISPQNNDNSTDILNISPIKRNIRDLNPIERALKNKFSPLEITQLIAQPRRASRFVASTPKKQESILNYMNKEAKINQSLNNTPKCTQLITPFQRDKPCIACTRLSKEQVIAISALTNKKLATYSNSFNSSVTHMIVSVNEKKCIQDHTMKFVCAVAAGIWVLNFEWIQECLSQNKIAPEEAYEALDVSGIPGPRLARLTRLENPLLKGYRIYAASPFLSVNKPEVENVIKMLGGTVVVSLESLHEKDGIRLIVTEAKATQDFDIYETWLEAIKVVTVDIEWLSRSVGQYKLLSLRPFALCSDDNIGDLGYPEELLVDTPFSFSQSIYST